MPNLEEPIYEEEPTGKVLRPNFGTRVQETTAGLSETITDVNVLRLIHFLRYCTDVPAGIDFLVKMLKASNCNIFISCQIEDYVIRHATNNLKHPCSETSMKNLQKLKAKLDA